MPRAGESADLSLWGLPRPLQAGGRGSWTHQDECREGRWPNGTLQDHSELGRGLQQFQDDSERHELS